MSKAKRSTAETLSPKAARQHLRAARTMLFPSAPAPRSLNRADRHEHDGLELELVNEDRPFWGKSGEVPKDLYGHLFVNTAAGTVVSKGLPYPVEDSTTILAGDAYMMRFDFDGGKVKLKSKLLRTPCYYFDEESQKDDAYKMYRFFNHGILRFNWLMGARNMNNTAFYPLPAPGAKRDDPCRLLATWDAGRPWEIDPETLEAKTPVGRRDEWYAEAFGTHPFPTTFSTAHPQWDAEKGELFTVNYGKGIDALARTIPLVQNAYLMSKMARSRRTQLLVALGLKKTVAKREEAFVGIDVKRSQLQDASKTTGWLPQRFTHLLRWDGEGDIERFQMVNQHGASVGVEETVHQMAVTKNFVILLDTGFKVGLDALYGDPFPFLPQGLRGSFKFLTTRPVTPYSTFHIVKRSDLDESLAQWKAKTDKERRFDRTPDVRCTTVRVPSAACHFVADFEDDGHRVVLHVAHSDATDVGEWVRAGAVSPYTGKPVDPALFGLPGVNAIDTNRVARYIVDTDWSRVVDTRVMSRNPYTWTVALYAERTAGLPVNFSDEVRSIVWNSIGFFPELATKEMTEMYENYIHRQTPIDEILQMPDSGGRPSTVFRVDTDTNQIIDDFILPPGFVCSSPQFVPRKGGDEQSDTDGYITIMVFPPERKDGSEATPELWILDAARLCDGPVCMLRSDQFKVGFTIHSAWLGALKPYDPSIYRVDVPAELRPTLDNRRRGKLKKLFEEKIFPHFS